MPLPLRHQLIVFLSLFSLAAAPATRPTTLPTTHPADDSHKFLRYIDPAHDGGRLESAIVTYRNANGITLDLIAAVHVADASYFTALNERFKHYDAVLYEMVKPKDSDVPRPGEPSASGVSSFQRWLKNTLDLQFQLDAIDYTPENFIHADLDAETFFALQKERGESLFTLMLQSMLNEMMRDESSSEPQPTIFDLLAAAGSPDRARRFKLILAHQFNDIEAAVAGLTGPNGSVILTERNKAALSVLRDTLKSGKTHIAIFYGAAHLSEMESHLLKDFTFHRTAEIWLTAWNLSAATTRPTTIPAH